MNQVSGFHSIVIGHDLTETEPYTANIGGARVKMTEEQFENASSALRTIFEVISSNKDILDKINNLLKLK